MLKPEEAWLYGFSAELSLQEEVTAIREHKHTGEGNQDLIECESHHWEDLVAEETSNLDRERIAKGHSQKTIAKQTLGHRRGKLSPVTIQD